MSPALWTGTDAGGRPLIDPLAELAHDLNQPLSTIRALVTSMTVAELSPDEVGWHLANIAQQVDQLGDYVHVLLAILVDGRTDTVEHVGYVEANCSVAAVVQCFAVTWPGHITTVFGEEAVIPAPPELLRRSVRNVLDNAARAAGTNGAILVSVNPSRVGTSIEIEDDGPGFGAIAGQHMIGLKVVERTLSAVGGSLEITTSEALGGARVAMTFPSQSSRSRTRARVGKAARVR